MKREQTAKSLKKQFKQLVGYTTLSAATLFPLSSPPITQNDQHTNHRCDYCSDIVTAIKVLENYASRLKQIILKAKDFEPGK